MRTGLSSGNFARISSIELYLAASFDDRATPAWWGMGANPWTEAASASNAEIDNTLIFQNSWQVQIDILFVEKKWVLPVLRFHAGRPTIQYDAGNQREDKEEQGRKEYRISSSNNNRKELPGGSTRGTTIFLFVAFSFQSLLFFYDNSDDGQCDVGNIRTDIN